RGHHQSRRDLRPRGGWQPDRRLRSERRPTQILPVGRWLPAVARLDRDVPGSRGRRQRLHLRALLHGRGHGFRRLPDRRLQRRRRPLALSESRRQRRHPRGRLLAQHLRRQLHGARRRGLVHTPPRPRPRRAPTVDPPVGSRAALRRREASAMAARARCHLAALVLAGVVALGSDPCIASADEPEQSPAPQPKLGAWAAHAHRVASVKRPKPRRPDKLPPSKAPRLDVPRASTSQCANLSTIPAPGAGEILFVANGPLVGNNAFILRYASAFSGTSPCTDADLLVSFPETALLFGENAALILSSTSGGQTVYSFWGTEPFGTANVYFPDTGPNQFGIRAGDLWVVTPRTLYAAGAACPHCPLGDIPVNGSDLPNWNPLKSTAVAYNRVHNLAHADLTGATLTGTFADWDFTGANLTRANLTSAVFTSGTKLADVQFSGATLDGAVFENSDLTGASLTAALWDPARPPRFE